MLIGGVVIAVVLGQSVFFLVKAYRRALTLGIDRTRLRGVIISSALFTIAPSLAIVATVLALSNALGIILPWIRLSVIGNISQETTAATAALESVGGTLAQKVSDPEAFTLVAWVMTLGSCVPLILLPLFLKKLQGGVNKAEGKIPPALVDALSAAAFIGLIAAFVARAIAGKGKVGPSPLYGDTFGDGAGVMSVVTLLASVVCMIVLQRIAEKKQIRWLETFAMPISMFFAMGVAVLTAQLLPENIAFLEWRG